MRTTFGQRLKQARAACNLSQAELARAIAHITKSKANKSLVSQWELDKVSNPQNATLLAISAVTGYAVNWLVSGKGPEKVTLPALAQQHPTGVHIDRATWRRAIIFAAKAHTTPESIADAAIEVAETLADEPGLPDSVLQRIARLANKPL